MLVCGGRAYNNWFVASEWLDQMHRDHPIAAIIHGGARGADSLAGRWAHENGVVCETYRAEWERLGKRAGPIRNQQMLDNGKPDCVVWFPGGAGTADMVRRAEKANVPTLEVRW